LRVDALCPLNPPSQVVNYCASKLAELGVPLAPLEVTWDPDSRLPPPAEQQQQHSSSGDGGAQQQQLGQQLGSQYQQQQQPQQQQYLELTCNGMVRWVPRARGRACWGRLHVRVCVRLPCVRAAWGA
jgi:hypothetical protein